MISAGEPSGELYGALLSRQIKKNWPDAEIFGIGGTCMENEGVRLLARVSNVIGLVEALRHARQIREKFKRAREALEGERPDVLVLIDYPDFNMALAKRAKSNRIPVLYYVSPQVWAWRRGRIKKMALLVDKIALLFPFEVDFYRKAGIPCEFVGHPIAETIEINETKEELKRGLGLAHDRPVISLLPGSRPVELQRHLPVLIRVAARLHKEMPDFQVVFPLAEGTEVTGELNGPFTVLKGRTREVLAVSEASAIASGTATLEAALMGTPMVVFYKLSPLTYLLARPLVKVRFISLVNILSGDEVVKELIQTEATADNIFKELKRIVEDIPYRDGILSRLGEIQKVMGQKRASAKVASMVGEIAGWNSTGG